MPSFDGAEHVPLGEGLAIRRFRMKPADIVRLRGVLAGYDGLASAHGDKSGITVLVTTTDRERELDGWLSDLALEIEMIPVS